MGSFLLSIIWNVFIYSYTLYLHLHNPKQAKRNLLKYKSFWHQVYVKLINLEYCQISSTQHFNVFIPNILSTNYTFCINKDADIHNIIIRDYQVWCPFFSYRRIRIENKSLRIENTNLYLTLIFCSRSGTGTTQHSIASHITLIQTHILTQRHGMEDLFLIQIFTK